ncbi:hypothetical protein AURDEDRAFT_112681 [Auricularia subglabra TFB-10046 SS5]|nr:hypothetical protein AURDEDRAFT_112681 [Auricularia subglabra TFB-10046 SS5]
MHTVWSPRCRIPQPPEHPSVPSFHLQLWTIYSVRNLQTSQTAPRRVRARWRLITST